MLTVKESPPQNKETLSRLLILVRRVRNNLFHPEKYKALLEGDSKRDTDLLDHGLTILYSCLKRSTEISDKFYSESKWELDDGEEQETEDD